MVALLLRISCLWSLSLLPLRLRSMLRPRPSRHPLLVLCRNQLRNASAPGKEKGCEEERKSGRLVWWRKGRNGRRKSSDLSKQKEMWHFLGRLALVVAWLVFAGVARVSGGFRRLERGCTGC